MMRSAYLYLNRSRAEIAEECLEAAATYDRYAAQAAAAGHAHVVAHFAELARLRRQRARDLADA